MNNPRTAYLETTIVSGLARGQLDESGESRAMIELLGFADNVITFVTSETVLEELEKIPRDEYKTPHLAIYHLLKKIKAIPEPSLTRLGLLGLPATNPDKLDWDRIEKILPDAYDIKHVYQAFSHNVDYFVTVDANTILKYKEVLKTEIGVSAVRPSELLNLIQPSS